MASTRYPQLFEMATDRSLPLGEGPRTTVGAPGHADLAIEGWSAGQFLFLLERRGEQWAAVPAPGGPRLVVNQVPVTREVPLTHLAIVQADRHVFVFIAHDDPAVSTGYSTHQWLLGTMLGSQRRRSVRETISAGEPVSCSEPGSGAESAGPAEWPGAIELGDQQMLIGRDSQRVEICLPDIRVSRVHAWIRRHGKTVTVGDLKSINGTFVDGRRIHQTTELHEGSRVQIGPYVLTYTGTALYRTRVDRNVQLVARHLVQRVPDRERPGQLKTLLDDVSLVFRPGELVCILGPSGSGKSTLLTALSARHPAQQGSVLFNGEDLYANFDAMKQNLAFVPQRDALHEALSLQTALRYTARLRLPGDVARLDIDRRIDEMLQAVQMVKHRATPIRRLSGGEAKRASWVHEAICNPSLIFLDEVTSGLDEQADREMMKTFRTMAGDGKTIICVTHRVSNVERTADLVVILTWDGVLAFVGPPAKALEYFEISQLGDVYQALQERSPAEWKQRFLQSPYYERYVQRRLPAEEPPSHPAAGSQHNRRQRRAPAWRGFGRQLLLLTRRYTAIQLADLRPLAMMLGQSLFIALLLIWLFGDLSRLNAVPEARKLAEAMGVRWEDLQQLPETQQELLAEAELTQRAEFTAKILFLLCISCLWFGCNNAAKEIVKERVIYLKERDVGLNVVSYYGSKLILLCVLSLLQVLLLYGCVRLGTRFGGDAAEQVLLLALASWTGVGLGLAISALSHTEDLAVTIVPISLIPQITLAGLIAPLVASTRLFAQIGIPAYWTYQGLLQSLGGTLQQRLRDAELMDLGAEWTLGRIGGVLLAQLLVLAAVAVITLYARDAKDNRLSRLARRLARRFPRRAIPASHRR